MIRDPTFTTLRQNRIFCAVGETNWHSFREWRWRHSFSIVKHGAMDHPGSHFGALALTSACKNAVIRDPTFTTLRQNRFFWAVGETNGHSVREWRWRHPFSIVKHGAMDHSDRLCCSSRSLGRPKMAKPDVPLQSGAVFYKI